MGSRTVKVGCPLLILLAAVALILSKDQSSGRLGPSSGKAIIENRTGAPKVPVFSRPELIEEAATSRDDQVVAAMVLRGEAFLVDQRCEVAVVGSSFGKRKVRIMCPGPTFGMRGWVPAEWVK